MLTFIERQGKIGFAVSDLCSKDAADGLSFSICADGRVDFDPLYEAANSYFQEGGTALDFVREVVGVLYRVGAVGIKLNANERFVYSHINEPMISLAQIGEDTQLRVHFMLHSALGIR